MNNNLCRICFTENNTEEYILKEMMFGTFKEFEYFKCSGCGCLQIKEFPENMSEYYPISYLPIAKYSYLKKILRKKREIFIFSRKGITGRILKFIFGYPSEYLWFKESNIKKTDKILDVGCGKGDLLKLFCDAGYNNLLGIDPFLREDFSYKDLKILKKDLFQIEDEFDWVMFHHSFEHLDNPVEIFKLLKKIVKKDGTVLIRIPLVDSIAWELYKTFWVQLDPPRHFFLHSLKSIKYLCDNFGFEIKKIVYDSSSFQFWGSEQYKKHISLMDPNSLFVNHNYNIFSKSELEKFEQEAIKLNETQRGDMASFYLSVR